MSKPGTATAAESAREKSANMHAGTAANVATFVGTATALEEKDALKEVSVVTGQSQQPITPL